MTIYTLRDIEQAARQFCNDEELGWETQLCFDVFLTWLRNRERTRARGDVLQFDLRGEGRDASGNAS